jgi:hypothetical protein
MSNSNKIFNVEEATGRELAFSTTQFLRSFLLICLNLFTSRSALETTAAEAQVEAPTGKIAREVEKNAGQEQTVAEQAAAFAEVSRIQLALGLIYILKILLIYRR